MSFNFFFPEQIECLNFFHRFGQVILYLYNSVSEEKKKNLEYGW